MTLLRCTIFWWLTRSLVSRFWSGSKSEKEDFWAVGGGVGSPWYGWYSVVITMAFFFLLLNNPILKFDTSQHRRDKLEAECMFHEEGWLLYLISHILLQLRAIEFNGSLNSCKCSPWYSCFCDSLTDRKKLESMAKYNSNVPVAEIEEGRHLFWLVADNLSWELTIVCGLRHDVVWLERLDTDQKPESWQQMQKYETILQQECKATEIV